MAIKGKGKTKPKQPARAPRHEPVPVKKPFGQRTWVRAMAAFIAGVFVMSMCWWVWEGLDKTRNTKEAQATSATQQQAVQKWKAELGPVIAGLGDLQGPTPQIATTLGPALDALDKGKDPQVTSKEMTDLATQLDTAATTLDDFKLADVTRDQGFNAAQVDEIDAAQTEIVAGLRSLQVAATVTALAIDTPGVQEALVATAKGAVKTGQSLLVSGWTKYTNVQVAVGLPLPQLQGLPAGSGS